MTTIAVNEAQTALDTHDALTAAYATEPDSDTEPEAWLHWYTEVCEPAYAAWSAAMNALATAGYSGGRHPSNFRPWCEEILKPPGSRGSA